MMCREYTRRTPVRQLPWPAALPTGYAPSLLGVLVFAAGGVGDLLWHEFFGVEAGVEAPFSPSHLALGIGLGLITTVALRGTAWSIHLWTGVIVEAGLAGCC